MRLMYIVNVLKSCKTIEQKANTILWSGRVLSEEESDRFLWLIRSTTDLDLAVQKAKALYLGLVE